MQLARTEFLAGLRASLPLLIAVGPFGLVTGVAMAAGGIPPLEAMAMPVLVCAGASMLAATQLIAAGAPALVMVQAAFIVNLRLFMYSASMRPLLAAGLSAGATAVLAHGLPFRLGLALAAAVGIGFGLFFERLSKTKEP